MASGAYLRQRKRYLESAYVTATMLTEGTRYEHEDTWKEFTTDVCVFFFFLGRGRGTQLHSYH